MMRKIILSLLAVIGVTGLLVWGLAQDDEAYWRAQVAKVHEGMREAEVEAILFPHRHSKIAALYDAIDQYLLNRNHGLRICEGGLGIQTCYYQVGQNLSVIIGYRSTPDMTTYLQTVILSSSQSTNGAPKFHMFVVGRAELTHMNIDN